VSHSSELFIFDVYFIQIWVLAVFRGSVTGLIRLWLFKKKSEI
jgi:hypothetical protein